MMSRVKLLALLFGVTLIASSCELPWQRKHIILFIVDGTQLEHIIAGSRYMTGKDNGLVFQKFPYQGYMTTWDVTCYNYNATYFPEPDLPLYDPNNFNPIVGYDPAQGGVAPYPIDKSGNHDYYIPVPYPTKSTNFTDSASAATAMSTGNKTVDGNICWLPGDAVDGSVRNISEDLKDELGYAIGIVSTVPFTHATPAGFVAHNVNRNNYTQMATEIITTIRPEVVIGGGAPYGDPGFKFISETDYNAIKADTGYVFCERQEGVNGGFTLGWAASNAAKYNKKLFGLFGGGVHGTYASQNGAFENPVPYDNPGCPKFDVNTENPTLADMVRSAITVLKNDPDGFFVMFEQGDADWANHFHDYNWMIGTMYDLNEAVKAAIDMVNIPFDFVDWSNTTLIVTADHANSYMRLSEDKKLGKGDLPEAGTTPDYPEVGEYVTYGDTTYHTNEPVMVYVKGHKANFLKKYEGTWYPETRLIDNTQLNKAMRELAGLE